MSTVVHAVCVRLCGRGVTGTASHARGSGFNSQSMQTWLRLPSFWGQRNKQQLLNSGWLQLKIANVNRRSGKSAGHASWTMWKLISPVSARQLKRTWVLNCSWSARNLHLNVCVHACVCVWMLIKLFRPREPKTNNHCSALNFLPERPCLSIC